MARPCPLLASEQICSSNRELVSYAWNCWRFPVSCYYRTSMLDVSEPYVGPLSSRGVKIKRVKGNNRDLVEDLLSDWKRERPDINVDSMAVIGRVLYLSGLLEARANRALRKFGLRYTDFDVLATLRRTGKPYELTPTQLRRAVLISSGAMTACLDRLENSGFIARRRNPEDRRGTIVRITAKGRKLIDDAAVIRFEEADDALAALSEREADRVASLLKKLTLHIVSQ